MNIYNRKLGKKNVVLILIFYTVLFGIVLSSSNFNLNYDNSQDNDNQYKNDKIYPNLPQINDYSSNLEGNGGNINVSLHQSLVDKTRISIVNINDTANTTFYADCPTDSSFNSSYIEIVTIKDLVANNETVIIEDGTPTGNSEYFMNKPIVASFQVPEGYITYDVYLNNITIWSAADGSGSANTTVVLYNSTWDAVNGRNAPGCGVNVYDYIELGEFELVNPYSNWHDITGFHVKLNNSLTENRTWFIGLFEKESTPSCHSRWEQLPDPVDDSDCYSWNDKKLTWDIEPYDFCLIVELSPANCTPYPDEINLKINNTDVSRNSGNIRGMGTWNSSEELSSASGQLEFFTTANWMDVQFNITHIQINYTKDDLTANSSFKVLGSGQDIVWTVSRSGGFNYFDSRFSNYQISFTIPDTWSNIQVWNGTVNNKTDDVTIVQLGNGYQMVQVMNAGNGSYWFLNATSANLMQSIGIYKGSTPSSTLNNIDIDWNIRRRI